MFWESGERGEAVIVATEPLLERSLIVDAPSLPVLAFEDAGESVAGDVGTSVSTCMGVGFNNFFKLTSLSGTGGGTSVGRTLAVFVDAVDLTDVTDLPFRGGVFSSGAGLVVFLDREGVTCEVEDLTEAFESRLGRVFDVEADIVTLEGVVDRVDLKLAVESSELAEVFLVLGIVNFEVEADNSDLALLKLVSVLDVAVEVDLESTVPASLFEATLAVEVNRGLVTVTNDGARRLLIDAAEDEAVVPPRVAAGVLDGVKEGPACVSPPLAIAGESDFLLIILFCGVDRALLVIVATDAAEAAEAIVETESLVETDRIELAEEVTLLLTEGVCRVLAILLRRVVGRSELAMLDASSSVAAAFVLRILGGVCLMMGVG